MVLWLLLVRLNNTDQERMRVIIIGRGAELVDVYMVAVQKSEYWGGGL